MSYWAVMEPDVVDAIIDRLTTLVLDTALELVTEGVLFDEAVDRATAAVVATVHDHQPEGIAALAAAVAVPV